MTADMTTASARPAKTRRVLPSRVYLPAEHQPDRSHPMSSTGAAQPPPAGAGGRPGPGARLREVREYLGFSRDEVAAQLAVAPAELARMEADQRRIDPARLQQLAALYQHPVSCFTGAWPDRPDLPDALERSMRAAAGLSERDREELVRFATYLRLRSEYRRSRERAA